MLQMWIYQKTLWLFNGFNSQCAENLEREEAKYKPEHVIVVEETPDHYFDENYNPDNI
jgi:hypothetical protein